VRTSRVIGREGQIVYHQTKGGLLSEILRDKEIRTTPRFDLTGKSQQELEAALSPRRQETGLDLYFYEASSGDKTHLIIWEKGEQPLVWLTTADAPIGSIWSSSFATDRHELREAEEKYGGFFRIGVDTSKVKVYPWREYEQRARVSKKWRQVQSDAARRSGDDVSNWFFALGCIASSAWTVIERWENHHWVPVTIDAW
jgi:hypothetical protein